MLIDIIIVITVGFRLWLMLTDLDEDYNEAMEMSMVNLGTTSAPSKGKAKGVRVGKIRQKRSRVWR